MEEVAARLGSRANREDQLEACGSPNRSLNHRTLSLEPSHSSSILTDTNTTSRRTRLHESCSNLRLDYYSARIRRHGFPIDPAGSVIRRAAHKVAAMSVI